MYAVNFIWHVQVAMIKCRICSHMAQTRHWDVRRAPLSGSRQVMHIGACIHICTLIYIHINRERYIYIEWLVSTYIYIYTPNIDLHIFHFTLLLLAARVARVATYRVFLKTTGKLVEQAGSLVKSAALTGNLLGLPSGKLTVCYGKSPCY